jgi:hypothetical protein
MLFQTNTGSEWHSTETRSAMVTVNGKPIYEALKPLKSEWERVGRKGTHGKWCIAEYDIPVGAHVVFTARANGCEPIQEEFVVDAESGAIDFEGYKYQGDIRGWIVAL